MIRLKSDIADFGREIDRLWPEMNDGRCDKAAA